MKTTRRLSQLYFFLLKLSLLFIMIEAVNVARADLLNPTIAVTPCIITPDCHSLTGCSVTVVKRHYVRCHPVQSCGRPRCRSCC